MYGWLQSLSQNMESSCQSHKEWQNSLAGAYIKHNLAESNNDKIVLTRRLTGFTRDTLTLNHSVASCLFILRLKERMKNSRACNTHLELALELAAESIMLHDMINKGNWCGIKKNALNSNCYQKVPLASLLVCCDELAIWQRRKLKFDHCSQYGIQLTLEDPIVDSIDLDLNNIFEIKINWGTNINNAAKRNLKKSLSNIYKNKCYNSQNGHRIFGGKFFGRSIHFNF